MSSLVCIKTFGSRPEAELAKGTLEAHGIRAVVSVDDAGGVRPEIGFIRGARLLVDSGDVDPALVVLSAEERPESSTERSALNARLRGCMLPAMVGLLLVGVGAAVAKAVNWIGAVIILVGAGLLIMAYVRGTRAA